MDLAAFQRVIEETYGQRDRARGIPSTVAWLSDPQAGPAEQLHELSDVLAWLATLANQLDLSLEEAAARYATGCPRCGALPCTCP
jgi:NTP pyrophosphatase (non-canonical NTP hydrolase)